MNIEETLGCYAFNSLLNQNFILAAEAITGWILLLPAISKPSANKKAIAPSIAVILGAIASVYTFLSISELIQLKTN